MNLENRITRIENSLPINSTECVCHQDEPVQTFVIEPNSDNIAPSEGEETVVCGACGKLQTTQYFTFKISSLYEGIQE